MSFRRKLALAVCLAAVFSPDPAQAGEPGEHAPGVRLHASGALARAVAGHQSDELGWGGLGLAAAEWAFSPELGAQVEVGALWLSEGAAPSDPRFAPQGAASSAHAALGLRWRPLATEHGAGWMSVAGGAAETGGLRRPMFDASAGYDLAVSDGRFGVGPMVGYLHVFQPDDELRPEDAQVVFFGLHATYDGARSEREPAKAPIDPDTDRDGLRDSVDDCPLDPEDKDGFEDLDGCPEADNDRDGLLDPRDRCPNDPEDKDGFEDADGCPDPDNDQDGILDAVDQCPLEPETKNGYADDDGCPDEHQVRVVGDRIVLDDRIHFATNSAKIRPVSHPLLERLAKLIQSNPTYVHIAIQGHADERGPEWFNKRLSRERAESVLEFLVAQGVATDRLSADGFGASRPLVDRKDERAWFMNRRVELEITRETRHVRAAKRGKR